MTQTVANLLNIRVVKADVGIEIELEADRQPPTAVGNMWNPTHDGSLRNYGIEYVSKPLAIKDVKGEVFNLKTQVLANCTPIYTIRAGVHIHVNCTHLTLDEVMKFACLYYILEETLTDYCSPDRIGNHFCLRAIDAEAVIENIAAVRRRGGHPLDYNMDRIRYAALNFKSLSNFGTLEFRALETQPDFSKIVTWAETLVHLREFSQNFRSERDIIEQFSMDGPTNFAEKALGPHVRTLVPNGFSHDKLINGMRIAQDFANYNFL